MGDRNREAAKSIVLPRLAKLDDGWNSDATENRGVNDS